MIPFHRSRSAPEVLGGPFGEGPEQIAVELPGHPDRHRHDVGVVRVVVVRVEEAGVGRCPLRQLERLDAEDGVEVDLGVARHGDLGPLVEPRDALADPLDVGGVDQVDLVDDDAVGADDLVHGLVVDAVVADVVEVLLDVLGVDEGDDGVERDLLEHGIVEEEGLGDRHRVGEPAGLDQDVVDTVDELADHVEQVRAHRRDAADAAVAHLDDLFVGRHHEVRVDVDLTELVLDHGDAPAVLLAQDVVEQRGLPRAEEAGEDRDRQLDCVPRPRRPLLRAPHSCQATCWRAVARSGQWRSLARIRTGRSA